MNKPGSKGSVGQKGAVRCAIYTRKSSEEGLEQEFNSLDAQREACEAYITSQKHEGWKCLADFYDDGGYSGGTIERPGLRELLTDIERGLVDVVVVYKVDRLTRSLADFARIVDILDTNGASFVSVTQAFNTTTSMGRLTLNVLLSFAQFEREVTGERIRDKIAASKKKGMWMGGVTPIGYRTEDRKLKIDAGEAETVRDIFETYLQLGSVRLLREALEERGVLTKVRVNKHGRQSGGKPFTRGPLYLLLQNRVYLGEIVHKEKSYPGDHEAIVGSDLWGKVQAQLELGRHKVRVGENDTSPSLLAGMVIDEQGTPLTPSHAVKAGKRYRYYVSRALQQAISTQGIRIPAGDIEHIVSYRLRFFFADRLALHSAIETTIPDAGGQQVLFGEAKQIVSAWQDQTVPLLRNLLLHLNTAVQLKSETVEITIDAARVADLLQYHPGIGPAPMNKAKPDSPLTFTVLAKLKRTGHGIKLHIEGEATPPDHTLIKLLVRADLFSQTLMQNKQMSIRGLGRKEGLGSSYVSRILRLHFLSPHIKRAIMQGRQPPELTAEQIMKNTRYSFIWENQKQQLGFSAK
jgi:site-specific DNA recombinase